jgi:hypothetical protein
LLNNKQDHFLLIFQILILLLVLIFILQSYIYNRYLIKFISYSDFLHIVHILGIQLIICLILIIYANRTKINMMCLNLLHLHENKSLIYLNLYKGGICKEYLFDLFIIFKFIRLALFYLYFKYYFRILMYFILSFIPIIGFLIILYNYILEMEILKSLNPFFFFSCF